MKNITTHTPDTGTAAAKFFAGEQKRGTLAGAAACNPTAAVRELGPLAVILAGCDRPAPAQSVATSQGAPTPGPWTVQPRGYCRSVIHRAGHPDQVVANAYGNEETAAANAAIIAAAPELLNMLQRMIGECGQTRVAPEGILAGAPCLLTLEHARAAIAKAKGGAK